MKGKSFANRKPENERPLNDFYPTPSCMVRALLENDFFEEFYKWALRQKELVIISEYNMPDDFICIDSIEKSVLLNSVASKKAFEKLFIPKHQRELYNNLMKRR